MSSMPHAPMMSPAPVKTAAEADALISQVMGVMAELADVVQQETELVRAGRSAPPRRSPSPRAISAAAMSPARFSSRRASRNWRTSPAIGWQRCSSATSPCARYYKRI